MQVGKDWAEVDSSLAVVKQLHPLLLKRQRAGARHRAWQHVKWMGGSTLRVGLRVSIAAVSASCAALAMDSNSRQAKEVLLLCCCSAVYGYSKVVL